jgi:hypothetical protein
MRERIKKILPVATKRSDLVEFLRRNFAQHADPVRAFEIRLRTVAFERGLSWSCWRRLKVNTNNEARATFFEVQNEAKSGMRWRRNRFELAWSDSFPPARQRPKFRPHIVGGGQTRSVGSHRS